MADTVIRRDIIQLEFESDALKEIEKLRKEIDELKKKLGVVDGDNFKETKESADKAKNSISKLSKAAETAGKALKKIASISFKAFSVGVTAVATGIGKIAYESTQAYAEFEQLKGGVSTLFGTRETKNITEYAKLMGKSVDDVRQEYKRNLEANQYVLDHAKSAWRDAGMSMNEYMQTAIMTAGSMKQSVGGDTKKAAELIDMSMKDMSDNVNKLGTDMGMVQNAYAGLSRGNYMLLDNLALGYKGTKEEAQRLVKDAAKLDKSVDANSLSYANLVKAIHAVQVEAGIYGTTQKEAMKTVSGSLKAAKSAWANLLVSIGSGEDLDKNFKNMIDSVETFADNIMPVVERSLTGIGTLIERIVPKIERELPTLAEKLLPPLIKAAVSLTKGLIKALPNMVKTVATTIVDIFGEQFPIIQKIGDFFKNNANSIAESIKIITVAVLGLVGAFKGFKAIKGIQSIFGGLGGKGGKSGGLFDGLKQMSFGDVGKTIGKVALIVGACAGLVYLLGMLAKEMRKQDMQADEILKLVGLIGAVGLVGGAVAKIAGVVGAGGIGTIKAVGAGMVAIAEVIGGMELIFVALGALNSIPGFQSLVEKGGDLLATTFKAIGKAIGSLVAGIGEGITSTLPAIGENIAGFTKSLEGGNYEVLKEFFDALSGIASVPSAGGIFSFFTGDPYNGLLKMAAILPWLGSSAKKFIENVGGTTDFTPLSSLLSAIATASNVPSAGGIASLFLGDPYKGLCAMILELPALGTAAAEFMTNIGGITDFTAISSLLNALASVKELPSAGGFAQFFTGSPYAGLAALILELPKIGTAVGTFYTNLGDIRDFTEISSLFNALASVKELPKAGGFAQFFTGSPYTALALLILELPPLGTSVGEFFNNIGDIKEFGILPSLFNALASVKELPKAGGFAQFFLGNPYAALGAMVLILPGLGESVKSFYDSLGGIDDFSKIPDLFNALGSLGESIGNKGGVWGAIKEYFSGSEETAIVVLGASLKLFADDTKGFFDLVNTANISNLNNMWAAFANVKELDSSIASIVKKVSELPSKMGEALKKSGQSLADAFIEVWQAAVKASVAPVNKLLSGANHILKEFGSDKRVISWEPYARGTNGHKGGNALVNDGRGAELVQMPNGYSFIPRGRNVLIPNAPKGMKVLPAGNTAQLMGRNTPTFRYANGTGDIDIWSFIDNPNGLVNKIVDGISYEGMSEFAKSVGKGMVSTFSGPMSSWIKKLYEEEGVLGLANYVAGKGVSQWRSTVIRALKMEGQYSASNVAKTLYQMQTESGGNPRAINLWDSNARKGIPSKGLMQVIGPTFNAYARSGFNKNIYDPLSNILASIRYAVSRYGSLGKAYRGVGYANGGIATKPSIFGESGAEMAIPLSANKRGRALDLWSKTGELLGLSYSPEKDSEYYSSNYVENNTYSPQFTLNITGTNDDRTMARKVKNWVSEAMDDMFSTLESKSPRLQEV